MAVAVHRLRRRYGELLRAEIAATVSTTRPRSRTRSGPSSPRSGPEAEKIRPRSGRFRDDRLILRRGRTCASTDRFDPDASRASDRGASRRPALAEPVAPCPVSPPPEIGPMRRRDLLSLAVAGTRPPGPAPAGVGRPSDLHRPGRLDRLRRDRLQPESVLRRPRLRRRPSPTYLATLNGGIRPNVINLGDRRRDVRHVFQWRDQSPRCYGNLARAPEPQLHDTDRDSECDCSSRHGHRAGRGTHRRAPSSFVPR